MKKITTAFITILLISQNTFSQNWRGTVNSDWNNANNWSAPPTSGSALTIDPANYTGAAMQPVIATNSTFTASTITILNGGQLTINANVSTTGNIVVNDVNSLLTINSGTLQAGSRLIIDLGGNMNINGGTVNVNQRFITGENSVTTMQNGTVGVGQRLLLDLGGIFNFNGGAITVGQLLALADGSVLNSCQFNMNGGMLTVNGSLSLDNEFGPYEPTFTMNAGTFNLNGDLLWLGISPGSGTPKVLLNGGNTSITGLIQNTALSTVNMYLKMDGNAVVNYSGSLIDNLYINDSIIQTGNSSLSISGSNSFNNQGVFFATNVSTYFNGGTILQGNGSYQFHTVFIQNAGSVNHQSPVVINISGDFNAAGNFIANTNTLYFNGSNPQTITSAASIAFYNLTADNTSASGMDINTNVNIIGHLELTTGKLNTSSTHLLTLNDNATSNIGSAVSFVNGPMIKSGNDAFVFPIGKNNKWRRMAMSAPLDINAQYKAEYFDNSPAVISPVNLPLTAVSNIEHWQFNSLAFASPVSVELYWEDASVSAITNCNELSIANFNGVSWDNLLSTATGTCTGTGAGSIVTNSAIANSGAFTFGFLTGVTTQNISFCQGDSIIVGNNTYTSTGVFIDILQDINNSDSIVVTNLMVHSAYAGSDTAIACGNYFWPTDGKTYSSSGIYTAALTGVFGCDSLATLYLTINNVDVSVTVTPPLLTANSTGANYQWVDCNNGFSHLTGETNQSYTAIVNGDYAVIITENGCVDTSTCFNISTVGITEINKLDMSVFPNPFSSLTTITFTEVQKNTTIRITDLLGKEIKTINFTGNDCIIEKGEMKDGIYFLNITDEKKNVTNKKNSNSVKALGLSFSSNKELESKLPIAYSLLSIACLYYP